jgi:hypothetical protein
MTTERIDLRTLPIGTVVEALEDMEINTCIRPRPIIREGTRMEIRELDAQSGEELAVCIRDCLDDEWFVDAHQPVRVVS